MRKLCIASIVLAALALVAGCHKHERQGGPVDPVQVPMPIRFGANPESRAMLENANFRTDSNKIRIFDLLTGFDGQVDGVDWPAGGGIYIDDTLKFDSARDAAIWQYKSGNTYIWTNRGTHRFFGYLWYDAIDRLYARSLFGTLPALDMSWDDPMQQIPVTTMTSETPQLDFLFAETYNRTMSSESRDYSSIPLRMQHLFTAISLTVENTMDDDDVTLESLSFGGIQNRSGATITFGPTTTIALTNRSSAGNFLQNKTYGVLGPKSVVSEMTVTESYDAFTGVKVDAEHPYVYRLVWPQDAAVVSPQSEPNAMGVYPSTDSLINISYTLKGQTFNKKVKFPYMAWERGKKYHFNLLFSDRIIDLTVHADDWDYHEYDMSFLDKSIEGGRLEIDGPGTVDSEAKTVTIVGGQAVNCHFHLRTPQGGTWIIGKQGDVEYFTVSPSSGRIDASENSGRIDIAVIPNTSLERDGEKSITLNFAVRQGERESDANSELNRNRYRFILPE